MNFHELLRLAVEQNASDLHLSSNLPSMIRVDGDLIQVTGVKPTSKEIEAWIFPLLTEQQQQIYQKQKQLDFAFQWENMGRFRANIFQHQQGLAVAIRIIPKVITPLAELGLPQQIHTLLQNSSGLILVTGPTGCGKSSTLASMIEAINQTSKKHIITLEDPIEFIHQTKFSLIHQREIGQHTDGFAHTLKSVLRQDPDILLIGEMRDKETIQLALTAAETGHLVLATLHTDSAAKTLTRIMDTFSGNEKPYISSMLADSLTAVISQKLMKRKTGGRIAAFEVLINTAAISHLIREYKVPQIYSVLQTNQKNGMHTMTQQINQLVAQNLINPSPNTIVNNVP